MRKTLHWMMRCMVTFLALSIGLVTLLRWVPVRFTPVMLKRVFQFRNIIDYRLEQEWVPLEAVSPELIKAVLAAEDGRFYSHHGFDWQEIGFMWKSHREEDTPIRGCSTLSQQTAKNVFTFGTPTVFRKAIEAYWTVLIELIWGKRRILEVYLNVSETGRGLFGAEAAAKYYYGIPARRLDLKQAAALAVCLPDPLRLQPDNLGIAEKKRIWNMMEERQKKR